MRVGGVDSFFSTLIGLPTSFSTAGFTSMSTRSMVKPTHSLFLLMYANGGEPVRVPMVSTPVFLILSRVPSCATAGARDQRRQRNEHGERTANASSDGLLQ